MSRRGRGEGAAIPLVDVDLVADPIPLPDDVRAFLREADRRIERFQFDHHLPGFVPSDFARVYEVLRAVVATDLTPGSLFCEWGSGFGVVTCLAAMLDFDAYGIEIEGELVDAARQLAADFDLPVEFARGSFIPKGTEVRLDAGTGFSWLNTDGGGMPAEMDLEPDDFNVIFAYPWPDEEDVIDDLFERHGGDGAILVSYHGDEKMRVQRKVVPPNRRRGKR